MMEPYPWITKDYNAALDALREKTRIGEGHIRAELALGPKRLARALEMLAAKVYAGTGEGEGARRTKATALAAAHTALLVILTLDREGGPANLWERR